MVLLTKFHGVNRVTNAQLKCTKVQERLCAQASNSNRADTVGNKQTLVCFEITFVLLMLY